VAPRSWRTAGPITLAGDTHQSPRAGVRPPVQNAIARLHLANKVITWRQARELRT